MYNVAQQPFHSWHACELPRNPITQTHIVIFLATRPAFVPNSETNQKCFFSKNNTIPFKMTDLKFIVTELNKLLKTDYNLISFDSLPIANLVQLLVDVLHDFGATTKVITNYIALQMRENLVASDCE